MMLIRENKGVSLGMWKLDLQKEIPALYKVDLLSWLALSQIQSIHFSVIAINECIYRIHLTTMN